jgi:chemotaxis protein MotB
VRRKRQRRRVAQEQSNHERWLVSYADFITLLFAFFVVLYASAQMDNKKVAQVAAAIKGAFQSLGVFSGSGVDQDVAKKIIVVQGTGASELPTVSIGPSPISVAPSTTPPQTNSSGSATPRGSEVDTDALKKKLEAALGDEIKKGQVQMRIGPDGLVVSIREIGFFDSGDAKLLPEARPTITRLAKILEQKDFEIRVEGHTDNVPIHTARFNSNWELSTARATEVVDMLVRDYGFDPRAVSVAGYAEFRPIVSNNTEEGRKTNRRIDLVVIGLRKDEPVLPNVPGGKSEAQNPR